MRTRRPIIWMIMLFLSIAMLSSCSGGGKLPDAQPLPAGQSWGGVWFSPQFEHMYLRQTGDEVRGIYTYKFGGTMEGKANGNLLKFGWIEPGDKNEARRDIKGKGWLSMTRAGDKVVLKGEWGYDDDMAGEGIWEAEYVRAMDADDPRSLEAWREEQGLVRE